MEEINTPPWVFFTFFILYKCYQITQRTTYISDRALNITLQNTFSISDHQEQAPIGVLQRRFEKFCKIYKKTPVIKYFLVKLHALVQIKNNFIAGILLLVL